MLSALDPIVARISELTIEIRHALDAHPDGATNHDDRPDLNGPRGLDDSESFSAAYSRSSAIAIRYASD